MDIYEIAPQDPRLDAVYPVMNQLRTEMSPDDFKATYSEGYPTGYRVAALFDEGECRAAAGYHLSYGFLHGRFMYIDDLVTASAHRSKRYGEALNSYLVELARTQGCSGVQLDSGTHRTDAHRFYFREGYVITSFHFVRRFST